MAFPHSTGRHMPRWRKWAGKVGEGGGYQPFCGQPAAGFFPPLPTTPDRAGSQGPRLGGEVGLPAPFFLQAAVFCPTPIPLDTVGVPDAPPPTCPISQRGAPWCGCHARTGHGCRWASGSPPSPSARSSPPNPGHREAPDPCPLPPSLVFPPLSFLGFFLRSVMGGGGWMGPNGSPPPLSPPLPGGGDPDPH